MPVKSLLLHVSTMPSMVQQYKQQYLLYHMSGSCSSSIWHHLCCVCLTPLLNDSCLSYSLPWTARKWALGKIMLGHMTLNLQAHARPTCMLQMVSLPLQTLSNVAASWPLNQLSADSAVARTEEPRHRFCLLCTTGLRGAKNVAAMSLPLAAVSNEPSRHLWQPADLPLG